MARRHLAALVASALLLLCAYLPSSSQSPKDDDLITRSLPGLNFAYTAKQYSGYLHLSSRNNIHYWFLESQSNPVNDPLILWVSGGPGCSSLEGLFTTVGPFYPNPDGESLFENIYSWNKLGNMLFLDSPHDAGFSYRDPDAEPLSGYSDEAIAADNAESVQEFLKRFPEYAGRDFYVLGESYGGIYVPSLTVKLIQLIQSKQLNLNLLGIGIGNGLLSIKEDINSFISVAFYRGILGVSDMNYFRDNCCAGIDVLQRCDFSQYVVVSSDGGVIMPNYTNTYPWDDCADKIVGIIKGDVYDIYVGSKLRGYNILNTNVDCYSPRGHNFTREAELMIQVARTKEALSLLKSDNGGDAPIITDGLSRFADLGSLYNTFSTDPFGAFPCYSMSAIQHYLNSSELRRTIGIPPALDGKDFTLCEYILRPGYQMGYNDTAPLFEWIMNSDYPLNILIYSGDSDMLINFLGTSNFVHSLPLDQLANRERFPWLFQSHDYLPMVVGYYERFTKRSVNLDLVTVASAGHMAPQDLPGPTMQMIANFMTPERDYSQAVSLSAYADNAPTLRPIPPAAKMSRKQADRVHSLLGLTFPIYFNHYSGYLRGGESVFLHYWLLESQSNPANDPLVLWLNGGPGCSSLVGLLSENGPFHANPDGSTLYENPHSWNKVANVLYLESPVGVGYSYRGEWSFPYDYEDHNLAETTLRALLDFFDAYPEYTDRAFYITGEYYSGIYIPMLAQLLVQGIQSGKVKGVNFAGMAIGNGLFSHYYRANSFVSVLYHHGFLGKADWDWLWRNCCPEVSYQQMPFCNFSRYIQVTANETIVPVDGSQCAVKIAGLRTLHSVVGLSGSINDLYNIYQDCYQRIPKPTEGWAPEHDRNDKAGRPKSDADQIDYAQRRYISLSNDNVNTYSTDPIGGFPCYREWKIGEWINQAEVREALHIPSYVQQYTECSLDIRHNYTFTVLDTGPIFDELLLSNLALKILIYHGDVDFACNHIGGQWFVEDVAMRNGLVVSKPHSEWIYRQSIGGYTKQFQSARVTLDLVTVKGSGQLVPMDRPGPALQMFANFLGQRDYSSPLATITELVPLKLEYQVKERIAASAGAVSGVGDQLGPTSSSSTPANSFIEARRAEIKARKEGLRSRVQSPNTPINPPPRGSKKSDWVKDLPGITFNLNAKQYSGYLNADTGVYFHYWLIESQGGSPSDDPLILWLNGGPGCSSLGGLLTTLGPFRPTNDQTPSLVENPWGWTKLGNVLFLEAPRGVGFSYSTSAASAPPNQPYNDTVTARQNVGALLAFFKRFPEYKNRDFYITGESYAGVYIPTLLDELLRTIKSSDIDYFKLVGAAIGNGELSAYQQLNSAMQLSYFRSFNDLDAFKSYEECCPPASESVMGYLQPCDFTQYVDMDLQGYVKARTSYGNATVQRCGELVEKWAFDEVWMTRNYPYNTYLDCYGNPYNYEQNSHDMDYYFYDYPAAETEELEEGLANARLVGTRRAKRSTHRGAMKFHASNNTVLSNTYSFVDEAKLYNRDATDPFQGQSCYVGSATVNYLRRTDVRRALHVDIKGLPEWNNCNSVMTEIGLDGPLFGPEMPRNVGMDPLLVFSDVINLNYVQQNFDTTPVFKSIFSQLPLGNVKKLKLLFYNGDVDMVCNFLGDQWFVENLAAELRAKRVGARSGWNFTMPDANYTYEHLMRVLKLGKTRANFSYLPRLAGFAQRYKYRNLASFTAATVKGGGHMTPHDRPGPMLQLIRNWISDQDFSTTLPYSIVQPSLSNINVVPPPPPTKAAQDKIWSLPGVTFTPNFGQHAGYVRGAVPGNYLFYWLVEPQQDYASAPVLLWLTGGPGCASTAGMMSENGPFRVNPDGRTLFENVHSWNKAAFVIYLDSPRGVGFSFQDKKENNSTYYNDDLTADDVVAALADLYAAYPTFNGREFYITGESYAGVYIPVVTKRLMDQLQRGSKGTFAGVGMNFKGFAIGNGYFSVKWDVATIIDFAYFRGILSKKHWDDTRLCCEPRGQPYCQLENNRVCNNTLAAIWNYFLSLDIDRYNMYQQCYELPGLEPEVGFAESARQSLINALLAESSTVSFGEAWHEWKKERMRQMYPSPPAAKASSAQATSVDTMMFGQQLLMNYASNDQTGGYQCCRDWKILDYFKHRYVREALHIPDYVQEWKSCTDIDYTDQYNTVKRDMTDVFQALISHDYVSKTLREPFRMLIYNGDSDLVCSFMEAEFFITALANATHASVLVDRQEWLYTVPNAPDAVPTAAGFLKSFNFSGAAQLDLLTVKGSGHFVPLDRGGPALQMLYNFFTKTDNYNVTLKYSVARAPLKPEYLVPNSPAVMEPEQAPTTTATTTTSSFFTSTATTTSTRTNVTNANGVGGIASMNFAFVLGFVLLSACMFY